MKTPKEWFEEELSGEPLTQESVIEVLEMIQKETWNEALDKAIESAEIDWTENDVFQYSDSDFSFRDNDGNWCKINISEDSILKLKL